MRREFCLCCGSIFASATALQEQPIEQRWTRATRSKESGDELLSADAGAGEMDTAKLVHDAIVVALAAHASGGAAQHEPQGPEDELAQAWVLAPGTGSYMSCRSSNQRSKSRLGTPKRLRTRTRT